MRSTLTRVAVISVALSACEQSGPSQRGLVKADVSADGSVEASVDAATYVDAEIHVDGNIDAGVIRDDAGPGAISVLTQHNDIARTGANLHETVLTTANVNRGQFGRLNCLPVDDQIYAQPLVVSGLTIDGGTRNVLYVATVNDSIYAFDADAPLATQPLWHASLLGPNEAPVSNDDLSRAGACGGQYTDYTGNIGIVGTPVIDQSSGTLYAIARSKTDAAFYQRLHAIDLITGVERANSPTTISATVPGTGDGTSSVVFDPLLENQRTGLLLERGVVYATWSGHCDLPPYHGWILGYRASDLSQLIVYNDTPGGGGGGIWMAGGGPAADDAGAIYAATANGSVGTTGNASDTTNRAESFLKLEPNAPSLNIASWFTPWNYAVADESDADFGITSVILIPGTSLAVSGAKSGELYVVDKDAMGGLNPLPVDDQVVQTLGLPVLATPGAAGFFGGPTFWNSPNGPLLYAWGSNSNLVSYRLDSRSGHFDPQPFATGGTDSVAPLQNVELSLSANGSDEGSGVLWATHAVGGNPNHQTLPGILRAFDAADVSIELWNSSEEPARDSLGQFAKCGYPTIANGRVFVPTFSNQVCVYGLLDTAPVPTAPIKVAAVATSNTSVRLTWTDNSGGQASFIVQRAIAGAAFVSLGKTIPPKAAAFDDVGLEPYAPYAYRMQSILADAVSEYSNTANVVTNGGPPAPSLVITGNGEPISVGSTSPSSDDLTDFGAAPMPGTVSRTFALVNGGEASLAIEGIQITGASGSGFTLAQSPASSLAPGATDTFIVRFAPATCGDAAATVIVSSNDPTNAIYSFAIRASGIGDLVGWWKFDDGSGSTASDSSGYDDTATLTGTASFVASGRANDALLLSGMSSAEVQPVAALSPSAAMTIATWIYPLAPLSANANPRFVQKGATDDQYRLLVEGGALKFDLASIGDVAAATLPPSNEWTHVAGTYDGSTMTLWVNGVAVATTAATGPIPTTLDPLFIGAKEGSTVQGDYFQGLLDDTRVYRRALAAEEIEEIALGGLADGGGPVEAGTFDASKPDASGLSVSFGSQVQTIFSAHCTFCHANPGPASGLDLTEGNAFANLVGVRSAEQPSFDLVQPGSAGRSYLYAKLVGATNAITISGAVMPQGGAQLSSAELFTILNWITEDAPND